MRSREGAFARTERLSLYRGIAEGLHEQGARGKIAFVVSTADLGEGKGDLYVALVIAASLRDQGWGVTLWAAERWAEPMPSDIDTAIVMIESFVPGLVDRRTSLIAWVRNWASDWASLPYLHEYDAVWCSSQDSAEVIRVSFGGEVLVVPIATDPVIFAPHQGVEHQYGVVTTANFWGVERGIARVLAELAETLPVTWFGRNGEHIQGLGAIEHREPVPWESLNRVYSTWSVVVDDIIPAAAAYGNHNSRLFDALACGAMVITNERRGLSELGLSEVATYTDGIELREVVETLLGDPVSTAERADRLRAVVLERHTGDARVAELLDHLDVLRPTASAPTGPRELLLQWATRERETRRNERAELDRARSDLQLLMTDPDESRLAIAELERELGEARRLRDDLARQLDAVRASRSYRLVRRLGAWRARVWRH